MIGGDATLNRIGVSGLVMQADAFFGSVLGTALGLQAPEGTRKAEWQRHQDLVFVANLALNAGADGPCAGGGVRQELARSGIQAGTLSEAPPGECRSWKGLSPQVCPLDVHKTSSRMPREMPVVELQTRRACL